MRSFRSGVNTGDIIGGAANGIVPLVTVCIQETDHVDQEYRTAAAELAESIAVHAATQVQRLVADALRRAADRTCPS